MKLTKKQEKELEQLWEELDSNSQNAVHDYTNGLITISDLRDKFHDEEDTYRNNRDKILGITEKSKNYAGNCGHNIVFADPTEMPMGMDHKIFIKVKNIQNNRNIIRDILNFHESHQMDYDYEVAHNTPQSEKKP